MKRIGIIGASSTGEYAFNYLYKKYEILFFADNETAKHGKKIQDTIIISVEDIRKFDVDYVVIASVYYKEIVEQLNGLGIRNIMIFLRWKMGDGYKDFLSVYEPEKFMDIRMVNRDEVIANRLRANQQTKKDNRMETPIRKNALIVSYFFPPIGGGGVQRTAKFVKYLREFGYEPIVVTVDEGHYYWGENDKTLLKEIPGDIRIIRIENRIYKWFQANSEDIQNLYDIYAGVLYNSRKLMEFWIELAKKEPEEMLRPDPYVFWNMDVLLHIAEIVKMQDIDIVYTTGSPFSDYFVGYYIKKIYQVPWVMDFRDLWTQNVMRFNKVADTIQNFEEVLERELCKAADKIIGTSPLLIHTMIHTLHEGAEKERYKIITNGYDEMDFNGIEEETGQKRFRICFGGTIYQTAEVAEAFIVVVEQINRLLEEKRIEPGTVNFCIMGNRSDSIQQMIGVHDRHQIIEWSRYMEHKEYIECAWNSQILFLTLPREMKGILSGKIYEYIRMRAAILGIWSSQTRAKEMIEETGRGKNFTLEEKEEIGEFIGELYVKWKDGQVNGYGGKEKIEKYDRRNLTKELAKEFDTVLKH